MTEYVDKFKLMKNFHGYDLTKCKKHSDATPDELCTSFVPLMMYEIASEIENAPCSDAAPVVHGHWIFVNPPTEPLDWEECSVCRYENFYSGNFKFCPNCGAKMDEEDEND